MDNTKEINTNPSIKEIESNEKSSIDYKPDSRVFVEYKDFDELKSKYEKLQYDFLNLQNHLKQVDKKESDERKEQEPIPEWFI